MKRIFLISIVVLLLTSCYINENFEVRKLNPSTRINRNNDAPDNVKNDTIEHISMEQDYQEVTEEASIVEDYSLHKDITEGGESLTNSTKKNTELNQVIKQPTAPPNQSEVDGNDQIEVDSSTPVETTPSPIEEAEEVSLTPLCPNAWYETEQPCDWIHPNLKPTDELGRTVPIFSKSEDAWSWAEKQLFDETSTWYMCGFNLMDGHTNDGTNFFYGYMKACP